ncbi:MAG: hypothetical protein K2X06_13885 [Burkholderiales bacterium]|nr:hypothetical protein [Burkholderiales bacterium]
MWLALGLSLSVHFLIFGNWGGSGAARTAQTVLAPVQARLELVPMATDAPAAAPQTAAPSRHASPPVAPAKALSADAAGGGPDLRFYPARELDRYPAPLSALSLDSGDGPAGGVRLWVSIDQTGLVVEAAVIDAELPRELERMARERVLATRFVPAWRDGRPVKSRLLMVLHRGA